MKNFTYYRPASVEQAVGLLENAWGNAELLAGGTDLHALQKEYIAQPSKVVSLSGIGNFAGITVDAKGARIGAGAKLAEIAAHAELRKSYAALPHVAEQIAGPQIRNMATLGGNLCQRNRCWYFRDEHVPCLLKGGTKCFALDGENKYHAIFTQGHKCVIVSPSTLGTALIALGATAEVQGPKGKRTVELSKFFKAPQGPNDREHTLEPNEVLLSVSIPASNLTSASYEVRQKESSDWPLVQASVSFRKEGNKATGAKVVLGHVGPTPLVAEAAGKALEGQELTEATASAAGKAAVQGSKPLSQNGYKLRLTEVAVKRAILLAAGVKPYWE